jgi:pimeloyl-ACP methyl ester carboxylesterase
MSAGLLPAMAKGHGALDGAPAGGREVATYASEVSLPTVGIPAPAPEADLLAEPEAVTVTLDTGDRVHLLDWGDPGSTLPPLLLVHGLTQTAWAWSPVARRLRSLTRVLAVDLRGHGLSETPRAGYDLDSFAYDLLTVLVAHGIGPDAGGPAAVVAGHGFGAQIAAWTAGLQPAAVAGLALVDGGWETLEESLQIGDAEFLRGLAEPPELLASMDTYLADRLDWDPASWDADQERAERARVDEKYTGRVGSVVRRHALAGAVAAMFAYRPEPPLITLRVPLLVLVAESAGADDPDVRERRLALDDLLAARALAGRPAARVVRFAGVAHNLMRYRPAEVSAELLGLLIAASEVQG